MIFTAVSISCLMETKLRPIFTLVQQALAAAEKQRGLMSDPSYKERPVAEAEELYRQKQQALADSERSDHLLVCMFWQYPCH